MFGCLLGQTIRFRDPDFLSVEFLEGTSVITRPKNKGFICHDCDNMRHVHNSLNMAILTLDCEQSLFFFRFSESNARGRQPEKKKEIDQLQDP